MKRQLKQPVEFILKSTPKPDFNTGYARSAQKHAMLSAVRSRNSWRGRRLSYRFGLHLRSVLALSSAGLIIMIGTGAIIAQANQALPGQPLYGLKNTYQRTQLALTAGEKNKLSRQIDQAETRLADVVEANSANPRYVEPAVVEATAAVVEIDDKLDSNRLQLVTGQPSQLSRSEVEEVEAQFRNMLGRYSQILAEVEVSETAIAKLQNILAVELDPRQNDDGYIVQLSGNFDETGQNFQSKGIWLNSLERVPVFVDQTDVEAIGQLTSDGFTWSSLITGDWIWSRTDEGINFEGPVVVTESATSNLRSMDGIYEITASSDMIKTDWFKQFLQRELWVEAKYDTETTELIINQINIELDGQKLELKTNSSPVMENGDLEDDRIVLPTEASIVFKAEGSIELIDDRSVFRLGETEILLDVDEDQQQLDGRWEIEGRIESNQFVAGNLSQL